jgi:predicted transcriptional regulator
METRTIILPAQLVSRLEMLAQRRGRSLDEMLGDLIEDAAPAKNSQWAVALAEGMEASEIDWIDDPDASETSRVHLEAYLSQKSSRIEAESQTHE